LQHLGPNDHPEELSGQFQGDIILTQEQLDYINEIQINPRTVLVNPTRHWPNARIPYQLSASFSENFMLRFVIEWLWKVMVHLFSATDELRKIDLALYNIEHFTCLRFVRRTNEVDFVDVEV
jgi:hypothetical protein